jgi:hypothetical protein
MNVGNISSADTAAQEAIETRAQTKAQATQGDQQAVRKLAQEQAASNSPNSPQAAASSAQTAQSKLDAKA